MNKDRKSNNVVQGNFWNKGGDETIDGSGGPPYFSGMERRVSKLEDKMDNVQSALSDIRVALAEIKASMATKDDVASLKEGINERPTRMGLWGAVATSVVIASGVVAVIMNFGHILHG